MSQPSPECVDNVSPLRSPLAADQMGRGDVGSGVGGRYVAGGSQWQQFVWAPSSATNPNPNPP